MNSEVLEYELIDISFELPYELPEEEVGLVREDGPAEKEAPQIEYDADGVPMGNSREEIEMRRKIIHEYIQQWREKHKLDPRVYNVALKDFIRVNQLFLIESTHHAVGNYKSTKAVLMMEEIMSKAEYIGDSQKKVNASNQKSFEKMLVMIYRSDDFGNVKMTVGIKRRTHEKIQYGISVPPPHTPFIDEDLRIGTNKKKRKKHHT